MLRSCRMLADLRHPSWALAAWGGVEWHVEKEALEQREGSLPSFTIPTNRPEQDRCHLQNPVVHYWIACEPLVPHVARSSIPWTFPFVKAESTDDEYQYEALAGNDRYCNLWIGTSKPSENPTKYRYDSMTWYGPSDKESVMKLSPPHNR